MEVEERRQKYVLDVRRKSVETLSSLSIFIDLILMGREKCRQSLTPNYVCTQIQILKQHKFFYGLCFRNLRAKYVLCWLNRRLVWTQVPKM